MTIVAAVAGYLGSLLLVTVGKGLVQMSIRTIIIATTQRPQAAVKITPELSSSDNKGENKLWGSVRRGKATLPQALDIPGGSGEGSGDRDGPPNGGPPDDGSSGRGQSNNSGRDISGGGGGGGPPDDGVGGGGLLSPTTYWREIRGTKRELIWFCSECGDGPMLVENNIFCTSCAKQRDDNDRVERPRMKRY